jgi:hypothetical protein
LRATSLTAVAIAAAIVLLTQGALVAHAEELDTAPVAGTEAVASDLPVAEVEEVESEPVESEPEAEVKPDANADADAEIEIESEVEPDADAAVAPEVEPAVEPVEGPGVETDQTAPVGDEPADVDTTEPESSPAPEAADAPLAEPAALVGENLPVVTEDDYFVIAPGGTVSVAAPGLLHNDSDPEKDPITTQQGAFTTWLGNTGYIGAHGEFGFTAAPGFTGTDTVTYYAQDAGHGGTTGMIYVTVQTSIDPNENHWPDTLPDTYTTPQDQPLSMPSHLGVLANDTDEDGDLITTQAVSSKATYEGGTVTIDADGSFYYTPPAGFIGEDSVGYVAFDTFGGGAWGTLIISVTPPGTTPAGPNKAPVTGHDEYTTPVNVPLHVEATQGALANDYDPEGTTLTAMTYNWGHSAAGGTGTVATDGSFFYVAPAGVTPQSQDYFAYVVTDEAGLSSHESISITFTDAVAIVDEPANPDGDPGTGHGHPGDPADPAGEPGHPAPAVGETPTPDLPSAPIVTASQTTASQMTGSSRDGDALAQTGFTLWQPLGGAIGVLLLGALGIVAASRRRRSR